ncbi:hypothetical protein OSB04_030729 [Centaurea solstitialis]|uniref:Uncharacterized protein n=1 Tax=Centaurea solstitialis TaxID=347529 RepID=A0AA38W7G3_9ASTR|nr:hypothetical protein OSB04_030729 [Centaurea solstitialis]
MVYISFGSMVVLSQEQLTEMAFGVFNSRVSFLWVMRKGDTSFLWVMRKGDTSTGMKCGGLPEGFSEAGGERGIEVHWRLQTRVLSLPAVSCFVTHCRWNSTMEALSSGVPVVAFPQWGDQVTNAKGEAEDRVVGREEIKECLMEATGGVKAKEMKKNSLKWKKAAAEAVEEGGSSDLNIEEFVDEIRKIIRQST